MTTMHSPCALLPVLFCFGFFFLFALYFTYISRVNHFSIAYRKYRSKRMSSSKPFCVFGLALEKSVVIAASFNISHLVPCSFY